MLKIPLIRLFTDASRVMMTLSVEEKGVEQCGAA
jgi:hypothetical protein